MKKSNNIQNLKLLEKLKEKYFLTNVITKL